MKDKTTVFQTEWFSVERETFDEVESLNGKPYYRINSPCGVIILATTASGEIILVNQFRPALNRHSLEFPSGAIDENESPGEAAARELCEETGFECAELRLLGEGTIMPSRINSREFLFYGAGAEKRQDAGGEKGVSVELVTSSGLKSLILSGKVNQLAALPLLMLADWKFGTRFIKHS